MTRFFFNKQCERQSCFEAKAVKSHDYEMYKIDLCECLQRKTQTGFSFVPDLAIKIFENIFIILDENIFGKKIGESEGIFRRLSFALIIVTVNCFFGNNCRGNFSIRNKNSNDLRGYAEFLNIFLPHNK